MGDEPAKNPLSLLELLRTVLLFGAVIVYLVRLGPELAAVKESLRDCGCPFVSERVINLNNRVERVEKVLDRRFGHREGAD